MIKLEGRIFHSITFITWQLLNYFQNLLGFYTGASARELCCQLVQDGTIQKIRVQVPIIKEFHNPYTAVEMKIIFNEYLPLLLQGSDIPPYSESKYKLPTEPLYVTDIYNTDGYYVIDILFIDSPESYRYFLQDKSDTTLKII